MNMKKLIVKATPDSDHRDGIWIVTKEQNAQGMDSKTAKIDKWLGEIGFYNYHKRFLHITMVWGIFRIFAADFKL